VSPWETVSQFSQELRNQQHHRAFTVAGVFTGRVTVYSVRRTLASDSIVVSFASNESICRERYGPLFLVDPSNNTSLKRQHSSRHRNDVPPDTTLARTPLLLANCLSLVNDTINRIFALILLILYFALLIASLGIGGDYDHERVGPEEGDRTLTIAGMSRLQITGLFLVRNASRLFGFLLAIPGGTVAVERELPTALASLDSSFLSSHRTVAIVQALFLLLLQ